ncbi:MAG TPA: Mu transposase C-terminal domain-containing protein [Bradyrhizobium sp.]|nr:Mu transposase C-terminal domain-containing protein [Bradyrhizobium sp.]
MAARTGPSSSAALSQVSERQRECALERYRKLQPHLERDAPLARVAKEASLPFRTAQRWVSRYRRFGLIGLTRAGRSDQGRRHVAEDLLRLAEGLALQRPPFGPGAAYREVCRIAQARGEQPPGYHTIYKVIRAIPEDLKTLALGGEKAYREAYDLVHRREAERPNQIWQADHTQLDLWAKRADGKTARPWLTVIIDDYSRAIAGFFISFDSPSTVRTALALRQAIWRKSDAHWIVFGIPEIFYTDNGSDFTSIHLEQVAADIKMRAIFSAPGQPRGRGRIERFFETVNQMFLCSLPGYIEAGAVRGRAELTVTDLERSFRDFLRAYHDRPHGETKIPPQERWQHGGFVPRMAESLEQLDLLLLTVAKARKIQADGVHFQGLRYIDPTLAAYVGESVVLRYDPRDLGEVRLFHQGKFLCRAICPDLAGEIVALRDIMRARDQRRRELRETLRDRRKTVETLLDLRRGSQPADEPMAPQADEQKPAPRLKRYHNE